MVVEQDPTVAGGTSTSPGIVMDYITDQGPMVFAGPGGFDTSIGDPNFGRTIPSNTQQGPSKLALVHGAYNSGTVTNMTAGARKVETGLIVGGGLLVGGGVGYGIYSGAGIFGFFAAASVGAGAINPEIINEIKALPDDAILTSPQITELGKNIDSLLNNSLPTLAARGHLQNLIDLFNTDPRFRFLDQLPGAIDKINQALGEYGASLDQ